MKTKSLLKAGVLCMAVIGVDLAGPRPEFGVSPADAKDFYTRKRIDGKWVTGYFPKDEAQLDPKLVAALRAKQHAGAEEQHRAVLEAALEAEKARRPILLGLAYQPTQKQQQAELEAAQRMAEQHIAAVRPQGVRPTQAREKPFRDVEAKPVRVTAEAEFAAATARPNAPSMFDEIKVTAYAPTPENASLLAALQRKARAMAEEAASSSP
jgi:hypothetical protein